MSVLVQSLQGANPAANTSFSDTLLPPDDPPFLGLNWIANISAFSQVSGVNLDTQVNRVAGVGATFNGPLIIAEMQFLPRVNIPAVINKSATRGMFAQMTLTQIIAGISGAVGIGVFIQQNRDGGYALTCQSTTGNWNLQNLTAGGNIRAAAVPATVVNDVVRLEVRPLSPTNLEFKTFKNGVLSSTDNFNPVPTTSPTSGMYSIYYSGGNGSTLSFKNFSAGLL
jgi:hypothetical protein